MGPVCPVFMVAEAARVGALALVPPRLDVFVLKSASFSASV